jgi:transposase
VPQAHPLRKLRAVVDALLATMNLEFEAVYARRGRPSVPPEMLLKALLLQILFSIRSERQLVEVVNYNLLYRWFVGLNIEDKVWDHSTFSAKGYDGKAFIKGCRKLKVTPHVATKDKHSRVQRHEGYKTSQKVRKRIEEAFG